MIRRHSCTLSYPWLAHVSIINNANYRSPNMPQVAKMQGCSGYRRQGPMAPYILISPNFVPFFHLLFCICNKYNHVRSTLISSEDCRGNRCGWYSWIMCCSKSFVPQWSICGVPKALRWSWRSRWPRWKNGISYSSPGKFSASER